MSGGGRSNASRKAARFSGGSPGGGTGSAPSRGSGGIGGGRLPAAGELPGGIDGLLLELLSDFQVSIPELGTVHSSSHPLVLLTSNAARELTEALKRRCLFLTLDYPTPERERDILLEHVPALPEEIAIRIAEVAAKIRELDLRKPPAISETIDWAHALLLIGADSIDSAILRETLPVVLKHRTDLELVAERAAQLVGEPIGRGAR